MQSIRTVAELPFQAALVETALPPVYQDIARKAKHLNDLGLSHLAIARRLGVTDKTVSKAIRWIGECG
jgi:predicted transcriptional regulator